MNSNLYKKALNYGLRLLLHHSRTKFELERKLIIKAYSPEICAQVIHQLSEWGYLDDKKFAENYILSLKNKGIGKRKVYYSLLNKGITTELATETTEIEINREKEIEQLAKAAEKKALYLLKKTEDIYNINNVKGKLYRFLMGRGFPPSEIKGWIDANFQAILDNIINKL